ncbi:unnamed protein product [Urochloa humidicola]
MPRVLYFEDGHVNFCYSMLYKDWGHPAIRMRGANLYVRAFGKASRVGNPGSAEAIVFPKLETFIIEDLPNWEEWVLVVEEGEAAAVSKDGGQDGVAAKKTRDAAPTPWLQLMPRLKELQLERCPKLRALPRQLGQEVTSLKELQLRYMHNHKARMMHAQLCPNLSCVERLDNLHELFLTEDMQGVSSQWLPGLQEQHRQLHGEDLDVYAWR